MVIATIGNFMQEIGMIRIEDVDGVTIQLEILYYLTPVFAVVIITVVVIMIIVAIFCRKAGQKDNNHNEVVLELENLESRQLAMNPGITASNNATGSGLDTSAAMTMMMIT